MFSLLILQKLNFDWLAKLLLLLSLLVILVTFKDYGVTWDEAMQHTYGQNVVNYYLSGRNDLSFQEFRDLYLYGGLFDSLAYPLAVFTKQLGLLTLFEARHLLNALVGWLGLISVFLVGRLIYGARGGFFSLVSILLMPTFYGHLFNNPKDIPFAAFFTLSIYAILRYLRHSGSLAVGRAVVVGVMIGLTLGVRLGGLLLFPLLVLAILISVFVDQKEKTWREKLDLLWFHGQNLIVVATLAYLLLILFWPYGQEGLRHGQPFATMVSAFSKISHFAGSGLELIRGQYLDITHLPWWYLPVWFGVSLPLLLLVLVPLGTLGIFELTRFKKKIHFATVALLLSYLLVPYFFVLYQHSVLYNAQRHFVFMFPLLAVLAGGGLELLFRYLRGTLKVLAVGGFLVLASQILITEIELHPYQTLYFNELAGGLGGAASQYELDYWGASYKEAGDWLSGYYQQEAFKKGSGNQVFTCGDANSIIPFLQGLTWTANEKEADFIVCPLESLRRPSSLFNTKKWREIKLIQRLGVTINQIYERT